MELVSRIYKILLQLINKKTKKNFFNGKKQDMETTQVPINR